MRTQNPTFFLDFNKADKALTMKMALTNKKNFKRGVFWVTVVFLLIITLGIIANAFIKPVDESYAPAEVISPTIYALIISSILVFYGLIIYIAYIVNVRPLLRDLHGNVKIIEQVLIQEKKYMPQNNTHHLYVKSALRLSIEVSAQDFQNYHLGDEINLEFTPNANIYLGYY